MAQLAAALPVELTLNAVSLYAHLPLLVNVLAFAAVLTVLGIFVLEPSASLMLAGWLHAPALRRRRHLHAVPALWRARVQLRDEPGTLQRITRQLAASDINVLTVHVHRTQTGVLDEFVLACQDDVREDTLIRVLTAAGATNARVWPTTPIALEDGQTHALALAARVATDPGELSAAIAELLHARPMDDHWVISAAETPNLLKIPSASAGVLGFARADEPFTAAETARAARLAELAEIVELSTFPPPAATPARQATEERKN